MSDLIETTKQMYDAFSRGDVASILANLADDVVWEVEGPVEISFAGSRHGIKETQAFFQAIANDHADPKLTITKFFSSSDAVATFGRYECTLKKTGKRVSTPVAHYFGFRDGKVIRFVETLNTAAFLEAGRSATA